MPFATLLEERTARLERLLALVPLDDLRRATLRYRFGESRLPAKAVMTWPRLQATQPTDERARLSP